ncbi:MAG: FliM/FliN family flagellar motor switch protein [Planctomycetota bacterium]|jgi:type III secretion system YscQ/HrcQ family protein|nr:FliM/FliN family flagellar motor switch protein [Planctomycetota bacterium]
MALPLRKISPETARLHSAVLRAASGLAFAAGDSEWRLEPGAAAQKFAAIVYGRLGEAEFSLWLDDAGWIAVAASVLEAPPTALTEFPEPLLRSAFACFADPALAKLEKSVGLPVKLDRLELGSAVAPASACRLTLRNGKGLGAACAWILSGEGGPAWSALAGAAKRLPGRERKLPGDFQLPGILAAGIWPIPAFALDGLAPGDVALSPAGPVWTLTVGGRLRFAADLAAGILSIKGATMAEASPVPKPGSAKGKADSPELARIGEAEVELQARVGRLTVTLEQLRRLEVGQVVEFPVPVDSPAVLAAGGRDIAVGELVDVGGRVGVRITALADSPIATGE